MLCNAQFADSSPLQTGRHPLGSTLWWGTCRRLKLAVRRCPAGAFLHADAGMSFITPSLTFLQAKIITVMLFGIES